MAEMTALSLKKPRLNVTPVTTAAETNHFSCCRAGGTAVADRDRYKQQRHDLCQCHNDGHPRGVAPGPGLDIDAFERIGPARRREDHGPGHEEREDGDGQPGHDAPSRRHQMSGREQQEHQHQARDRDRPRSIAQPREDAAARKRSRLGSQ